MKGSGPGTIYPPFWSDLALSWWHETPPNWREKKERKNELVKILPWWEMHIHFRRSLCPQMCVLCVSDQRPQERDAHDQSGSLSFREYMRDIDKESSVSSVHWSPMIHSPGGDSGWWVQFSPLLCTSSCCLSQGGRRIEKGRVRGRAPPRCVRSTAGSRCRAGWCCPGAGRAEGGPPCWTPSSQEAAAHLRRKEDIDTYKNTRMQGS